MATIIKSLLLRGPLWLRRWLVFLRQRLYVEQSVRFEKTAYTLPASPRVPRAGIRTVLVYHINGLAHAGTEKNLQVVANALAQDYSVLYMYGEHSHCTERARTLDERITLVPFQYTHNEVALPHQLHGMKPHLKCVLAQHAVDCLVTASPGYSHYPWNTVTDIPIVLLNVFGTPTTQTNVRHIIYNSRATYTHATAWIGEHAHASVLYAPIASMPPIDTRVRGAALRTRLGIADSDFCFGRIGRDSDDIFDPIAIHAWRQIAHRFPTAHFIIMSPAAALRQCVAMQDIPRVHFLEPSGAEADVWALHGASDCFAHFRRDGETSGVAIAESLMIGNPVITHRSKIWNAHLEYLNTDCARIAGADDVSEYARHMEEYLNTKTHQPEKWQRFQEAARRCGEKHFSPQRYAAAVREVIYSLNAHDTSVTQPPPGENTW